MLYDGPASRVEKILALKPLCGKSWSSVYIRWRSKSLFVHWSSDGKWDKINDWNYQVDLLLPKMSRNCVGARHVFSTNEQQKVCWQRTKLRCMILHYHTIIWAKICCCNSCTKLQRSMPHPWFPRFHFNSQKDDCFNFIESIWYGRSWPRRAWIRALERGEMNWAWKKNTFSRSNYNWVCGVFGYNSRDVMSLAQAVTDGRTAAMLRPPQQLCTRVVCLSSCTSLHER